MCTDLDQWSAGELLIVKVVESSGNYFLYHLPETFHTEHFVTFQNIAQFVLNKRYTLEAENRKTLLKLRDSNKESDPFSDDIAETTQQSENDFVAKVSVRGCVGASTE